MFVSNKTSLQNNNFQWALLYQYLRQDQDANAQAQAFCNWIGSGQLKPWMRPCLDLEEGSDDQSSRAGAWFSYVDKFFGLAGLPLSKRSWLYTGDSFGQAHGLIGICNSARHTWVAKYSSTPPALPHSLWQSTDGISGTNITSWSGCGKIDTSITSLTLSQLIAASTGSASTAEDDVIPAIAHWIDPAGDELIYHARIDPSPTSDDLQYMGQDTNYGWVNITGSNAASGVSMDITPSGRVRICYQNTSGHTAQYYRDPGGSTWNWQDLG
jgi:hypothetical protein